MISQTSWGCVPNTPETEAMEVRGAVSRTALVVSRMGACFQGHDIGRLSTVPWVAEAYKSHQ